MPEEKTPSKGQLSPRPYARLLTMMGDELIKNERIALTELIKNSYDADADWVQIRLINFTLDNDENTLLTSENSIIEIEDNGVGMEFSVIKDTWMNPASPIKLLKKQSGERKTEKGRVIQGEKGIGRFAIFKIGSKIELFTKANKKESKEIYLLTDLSDFDDDLISDEDDHDPRYLDDLKFDYEIHENPQVIKKDDINFKGDSKKRESNGTLIRITNLKGSWSLDKIAEIKQDIGNIQSPFKIVEKDDFEIDFLLNGESQFLEDSSEYSIGEFFRKAPVVIENGEFSQSRVKFKINGIEREYDLKRLASYTEFKERFFEKKKGVLKRSPECGAFSFEFYVFDLRGKNTVPAKYWLNRDEKDFIKQHRIYLSRDGIRVYPYGERGDDWLEIEIKRGTSRAGDYLSMDQTIGRIEITQENNPKLKDKTNREGLLEIGNALEDFKVLLRAILYLVKSEFDKYKASLNQQEHQRLLKKEVVKAGFEELETYLDEKGDKKSKTLANSLLKNYKKERDFLIERAEVSEDLAAVGLSVETASHDLMMLMGKAKKTLGKSLKLLSLDNPNLDKVTADLERTRGQLDLIEEQISGIQPLFRSSTRRRKDFRLKEIIEKVEQYFLNDFEEVGIKLSLQEKNGPFVVKTHESVLLQTFINLIDNSVYWLETIDNNNKEISIVLDKSKSEVRYSDSGPGIMDDDIPYIFESFFSTKGEGRGLGLYICRQLLERNDFTIEYSSTNKILQGANFIITF